MFFIGRTQLFSILGGIIIIMVPRSNSQQLIVPLTFFHYCWVIEYDDIVASCYDIHHLYVFGRGGEGRGGGGGGGGEGGAPNYAHA